MSDPHDPIETLRRFGREGVDVHPLPPEEVRRRGDRMRHRRHGLAVLAAVCAVAAIGVGVSAGGALTQGAVDRSPGPATSPGMDITPDLTDPPDGWVTRVPADFPLAAGLPETSVGSTDTEQRGPEPDLRAVGELSACGAPAHPQPGSTDLLGVSYAAPEDFRDRELVVFADEAGARSAFTAARDAFAGCPRDLDEGGSSAVLNEVRATAFGEESVVVLRTFETVGVGAASGLTQLHLVRSGNAVLVASESNEAGPDRLSVDRALGEATDSVALVAQEMCIFDRHPCTIDAEPAGELPEGPPTEIGPEGYGAIELGMTEEDVVATGATIRRDTEVACLPFDLEDGLVGGAISPDLGVAWVGGIRPMVTPDGTTTGQSRAEVAATHPGLYRFYDGWAAPVPGRDDRVWVFSFHQGELVTIGVHLTEQDCAG